VGRWRKINGPAVEIERRFRPNHHLELLPTSVSAEGF